MRAVIQRVSLASVSVEDQVIGSIGRGLLVLLGIRRDDAIADGDYIARKILAARIFEDEAGKMNRCVADINGELLIVSQFTLFGDLSKGARPSFIDAMPGDQAKPFFEQWIERLRAQTPLKIEQGRFAAKMAVSLVNDGPVTIVIDSK